MFIRSAVLVGSVMLAGASGAMASSDASDVARGRASAAGPRVAYIDGPTWYAIAGSFGSRASAERRVRELGSNWVVQRSDICTNYTPGLWLAVAGFFSRGDAQRFAIPVSGYAKECL